MAVPPKDPPTTPSTPVTVYANTVARTKYTVEIERMTKGPPKVTIRVDDDDRDTALENALALYVQTVTRVDTFYHETRNNDDE